jgi:hypothetical protein
MTLSDTILYRVIIGDGVLQSIVYKDLMYKNPHVNPTDGAFGYVMRSMGDRLFKYSQEYDVWHVPSVDPKKFKHLLLPEMARRS